MSVLSPGQTVFLCGKWPVSLRKEKKTQKLIFWGPETARWGGGLPRKGVGAEKFVPSLECFSSLGFEERNLGCPGNFAGMSRTPGGVQKVCANKKFVRISRSLKPLEWPFNSELKGLGPLRFEA